MDGKDIKLKDCPFCGGGDLDYSMKTNGSLGKKRFHATVYCKTCRAYGPRVLTETYRWDDFDEHKRQKTSEKIKSRAFVAWNTRTERAL